jgi:branched-chain amino acid transport system permease protein
MEVFGIPLSAFLSQLLLGLVNGSFYAMLSLGLAVIFGMLNIINFAHGALYMMGAFLAWMGLEYLGLNYWVMLLVAPLAVGALGIVIERLLLQWLYQLDHLYGLLLTFGITLVTEGVSRASPTRCPTRCRAPRTSASWCCRTTARGWWRRRWWCASRSGR